jgi:hypothetical protein
MWSVLYSVTGSCDRCHFSGCGRFKQTPVILFHHNKAPQLYTPYLAMSGDYSITQLTLLLAVLLYCAAVLQA